jgi:hypothetical protein
MRKETFIFKRSLPSWAVALAPYASWVIGGSLKHMRAHLQLHLCRSKVSTTLIHRILNMVSQKLYTQHMDV